MPRRYADQQRTGLELAEKKGRKRLSEIGYEECCQFRNCQQPISDKARSATYGDYCTQEHLAPVAADAQQSALTQVTEFADGQYQKIVAKRNRQLRDAILGA